MKKALLAITVLACTSSVLAIDMGEWTRNSNTTPDTPKPVVSSQPTQRVQVDQNGEVKKHDEKVSGTVTSTNKSGVQTYPAKTQIGYQNPNQAQIDQTTRQNRNAGNSENQQSNEYSGGSNNYQNNLPRDLSPQMASQLDREAANTTAVLSQIMRINVSGFGLSGQKKQALESYNASLQMLASMWVTSSQGERVNLDFELYNSAVSCTTKAGVSGQARSLLSSYSQIQGLSGFTQYIQSRGKSLGTTGTTFGC
jgi:hypothetical protein